MEKYELCWKKAKCLRIWDACGGIWIVRLLSIPEGLSACRILSTLYRRRDSVYRGATLMYSAEYHNLLSYVYVSDLAKNILWIYIHIDLCAQQMQYLEQYTLIRWTSKDIKGLCCFPSSLLQTVVFTGIVIHINTIYKPSSIPGLGWRHEQTDLRDFVCTDQ